VNNNTPLYFRTCNYFQSGNMSKLKIMIVDDEVDICNLFRDALQVAGYNVRAFTDPTEAFEDFRLHNEEYGVIITDIRMPKISGIELIKRVNQINKNVKVFLMTAFELKNEELQELKMNEFLNKPIYTQRLVEMVKRYLPV
jgi:two-component system phosphoglycerate transport system response regulator PgtA